MRLAGINLDPNPVAGPFDVPGRSARSHRVVADLQINNVIRTQRLNQMGFKWQISGLVFASDQNAFRPDAYDDRRIFRRTDRIKLGNQRRRERKGLLVAEANAGALLRFLDVGIRYVHDRAADKLRHEHIGWLRIDIRW